MYHRGWLRLLPLIVERIDVLIIVKIEILLSNIAFVAGAIKIILIKWVTYENRELIVGMFDVKIFGTWY